MEAVDVLPDRGAVLVDGDPLRQDAELHVRGVDLSRPLGLRPPRGGVALAERDDKLDADLGWIAADA